MIRFFDTVRNRKFMLIASIAICIVCALLFIASRYLTLSIDIKVKKDTQESDVSGVTDTEQFVDTVQVSGTLRNLSGGKITLDISAPQSETKTEHVFLLSKDVAVYEVFLKTKEEFENELRRFREHRDTSALPLPQMSKVQKVDKEALKIGKQVTVFIKRADAQASDEPSVFAVQIDEY